MGIAVSNIVRSIANLCENASLHSTCCSEREWFECDCENTAHEREHDRDLSVESWCCTVTLHDGEPLEQ